MQNSYKNINRLNNIIYQYHYIWDIILDDDKLEEFVNIMCIDDIYILY